MFHPDTNTNNIFITSAQDYIISFCKPLAACDSSSDGDAPPHGTINISHIPTGRCVGKLKGPNGTDGSRHLLALDSEDDDVFRGRGGGGGLGDVTSLHFSEERNELYIGNRQGMLHVWSQ